MTFIERIRHIANWIGDLFSRIPKDISKYAQEAIEIVDKIKNALDSQVALIIVDIIPGTWDNVARDVAVKILTQLSDLLHQINQSNVDDDVKKQASNAIYSKMASKLIEAQDKEKLPENNYDLYCQLTYSYGTTKK